MTGGEIIQRSDDILGGVPVFAGTRVPARTLIDYLAAGERLGASVRRKVEQSAPHRLSRGRRAA
jgi:hypothetical protein